MANRNFNRYQALEKEVKAIYCQFSVGALGAPTLIAANSKGIESVTRLDVGRYEIKLVDKYNALLQITYSREYTGASAAGINIIMRSEDVDNTRTIVIQSVDGTGAGLDLASGTLFRIKLDLKNSSVP